jgi:acetylornithine deacetylase/succinyl-diaminopimelate desuccinylase-like protein
MSSSHDPAAEVVDLCRDLIRIDTTNTGDSTGPGERKAAEHVAALLDGAGIDAELYESEPGRTSLLARWEGTADEPPILIHGHLDVVPARAEDWQVDPFSGEIQDGCVWGRGAVDMKDFDAILLSVIRARSAAGKQPRRPVVLAFTADEEAGGIKGSQFLVENHPEMLADCTDAVGEVGGFSVTVRDQRMYLVQAAEKGMAWLKLTAHGRAGHGSMRNDDNPVTRLAAGVARLGAYDWPIRLTPTIEVLLATVGELAGIEPTPENVEKLVAEFGPAARMLGAVIRNTANPTVLDAGYKVNVVPGEAQAQVDGRFLPGHEEEFTATVRQLLGEGIDIDYVANQAAVETSYDGHVVDAMHRALAAEDPDFDPIRSELSEL